MTEHVISTVQLGGRMWQLRIGHKVLQKFSAMTRVSVSQMGALLDRYDMMMLLLWCIVSEQDKTVKREQLDDWLDELPVREWQKLLRQIGEGIAANFPDEETEEEDGETTSLEEGKPDPTGAGT